MTRELGSECLDGYSTSIDAPQCGAPLRLRIPTKLGFKSAKNLEATEVTDKYLGATGRTKAMTGSLAFDGAAGSAIRSLIPGRSQLKREACTAGRSQSAEKCLPKGGYSLFRGPSVLHRRFVGRRSILNVTEKEQVCWEVTVMSRSGRWTGSILGAGILFLIALVSSDAMAQSPSPSSPSPSPPLQPSLPPSQSADTPPPGYLFSFTQIGQEPGQTLKNDGIYLRAVYVNDILANLAGGNKQGTTSTGDAAFGMNLDMNKIAGVPDAAIHVMFDDRTGLNASIYAGTQFGLSGENGPSDTIRLSELSWDESLLRDHLRLLVGRINPTPDFAFSDISCAFLSNITCAQPFAWYVNNSGVAFPVSTWGTRLTIKPTMPSYFRIGAYQDQPFQNDITEHGFDWGIQKSTGVFIPFEVGYQHGFGSARLPFKYDIGGYYDTGSYAVPPAMGEADLNRRGRTAFYAQAEQTVWRPDPMTNRSVTLFGGVLASTGGYADYPLSVYAGTYVRGPFASRPRDAVGFEATYVTINKSAEGQVIDTYNSLGLVAPDHPSQWILEADYHVAIAPGIQVVPDAQFVIHPDEIGFSNPRPGADHAFIVGVQFVINFGEALGLPQWLRVD